ncbi:DUF4142 domain-containing protein [Flavobacterium sp.]|uniref:DUF4142 domain-containing protein n=1 Tax=Flavobacterium sp. TaxID=239 RepID=UPI002C391244|nr:DUF4142 domain-containing protein [Flavobacterium sp.]HSD07421.1 DUF4142 domain-containing protein [Flavobacterium sp.]
MKKIFNFSKVILGAGLLVFTMNSCKNEPKHEDPKEVAEDVNDQKIDNDAVEDDADYLVDAAEINILEIEIGKLALQKGVSADVKKYAQTLVTDHSKALDELKDLATKKGITLPAAISDDDRDKFDDLNKKSGADFDEKFIDMMADGHKQAVDKYTEISQKATDADIKLWTSRQVTTLTTHHDVAKELKEKTEGNK